MQLPCGCSVLFSWQHSFSFLGLWLYIKRFFSNEETLAEEPGRGEMWHSCLVFSLQVENGQEQGNDGKCLEHLGVFIKRLSGFCHSLTMSKQNCMTWSWEAPRYSSRTDPLISLSPLQRSDYGDWSGLVCCCWHTVLFCFCFFKHGVHMFSLSESTQRGLFDVVFPCHDGMSVCSRAAVVW